MEEMVPDGMVLFFIVLLRCLEYQGNRFIMTCAGSIVAIQDVHQHMYFAVDREENKYSLAGAVHYSLVGDRALFRVGFCIYSHC